MAEEEAKRVAADLGVSIDEARQLIASGAMDAWQTWDPAVFSPGPPGGGVPSGGASSSQGPLSVDPFDELCIGRFVRAPHAENSWHTGEIIVRPPDGKLWWVNEAGKAWSLFLDRSSNMLLTGPDNPYFNTQPAFEGLAWDESGRLAAFAFGPDKYARAASGQLAASSSPAAAAAPASPGAKPGRQSSIEEWTNLLSPAITNQLLVAEITELEHHSAEAILLAATLKNPGAPTAAPTVDKPPTAAPAAVSSPVQSIVGPDGQPVLAPNWRSYDASMFDRRRQLQRNLHLQWSGMGEVVNPPEEARTYSSVHNNDKVGHGHARSMLDSPQGWSSNKDGPHWLQLDLGEDRDIIGFWWQGRADQHQFVRRLRVQISPDGEHFQAVTQGDGEEDYIFDGVEGRGKASRRLSTACTARYVRFFPLDWHGHCSARVAVLCLPKEEHPPTNIEPAVALFYSDEAHDARNRVVQGALSNVFNKADDVEKAMVKLDETRIIFAAENPVHADHGFPHVHKLADAAHKVAEACKKHVDARWHHIVTHVQMAVCHREGQGPRNAPIGSKGPVYTEDNCADPMQAASVHTQKVTWSCFFPFLFAAALNAVGIPALTSDELVRWKGVFEKSAASWDIMVARVVEANLETPELSLEFWLRHSRGGTSYFHPDGETQSRLVLDRVDPKLRTEHMVMVNAAAAELVQTGWVGGVRDDCKNAKRE